jgi:hypothetical protein
VSGPYTLSGVTEGDGAATGVPAGAELLAFADSALRGDSVALDAARAALIPLVGEPGMEDAAAVIGGFDGITRIADATGIPLEPAKAESAADFITALSIDRFQAEKI